jgi:hypothetical protein
VIISKRRLKEIIKEELQITQSKPTGGIIDSNIYVEVVHDGSIQIKIESVNGEKDAAPNISSIFLNRKEAKKLVYGLIKVLDEADIKHHGHNGPGRSVELAPENPVKAAIP